MGDGRRSGSPGGEYKFCAVQTAENRRFFLLVVWPLVLGSGLRGKFTCRFREDSRQRSLGLSATSQQYFSLGTNQPPATSRNQPAVLFSHNKPAPAISHQPTEQAVDDGEEVGK
jgi:hypothetical protein